MIRANTLVNPLTFLKRVDGFDLESRGGKSSQRRQKLLG